MGTCCSVERDEGATVTKMQFHNLQQHDVSPSEPVAPSPVKTQPYDAAEGDENTSLCSALSMDTMDSVTEEPISSAADEPVTPESTFSARDLTAPHFNEVVVADVVNFIRSCQSCPGAFIQLLDAADSARAESLQQVESNIFSLCSFGNKKEVCAAFVDMEHTDRFEIEREARSSFAVFWAVQAFALPIGRRASAMGASEDAPEFFQLSHKSEAFYGGEYVNSPQKCLCDASRMDILPLTAMNIPAERKTKAHVAHQWDFLGLADAAELLNRGDAYFGFLCKPFTKLKREEVDIFRMFVNVTSFKDEQVENNVPVIDVDDPSIHEKYIALIVKGMYFLPGIRLEDLTPELICTTEYQRACQPGGPTIHETNEPYTIRSTKPIIPLVFSILVQMKVSAITDPQRLAAFRGFDGMVPSRIILLERTKRDISKVDSIAKCRSVLIFYCVTGGLLVSHITVALNTSIPRIVASIVNTFGGRGSKETGETSDLTRAYMHQRFGDRREVFARAAAERN